MLNLPLAILNIVDLIKANTELTLLLAGLAILLTCAGFFLAWIIRQNRKERERWEAAEKEQRQRNELFKTWLKQRS